MRLTGTHPMHRVRVSLTFLSQTRKPPTCRSVGGPEELSRFNFKLIRVYQHSFHKTRIQAVL